MQALYRTTVKDVTLQGVEIPRGALIELRFGAANRDPRHFDCPAELDLDRANAASHVGFGAGIHHCLGAPLARRELYWGFMALLDQIHNIRLAPGKNDLHHVPHIFLRGLRELYIEFDTKKPAS